MNVFKVFDYKPDQSLVFRCWPELQMKVWRIFA